MKFFKYNISVIKHKKVSIKEFSENELTTKNDKQAGNHHFIGIFTDWGDLVPKP